MISLTLTTWLHLGCGMPRMVLGHALGPEISGLIEPFGSSHKRRRVSAKLTTEHSASSHGQPVIVLPDGSALDLMSWVDCGYRVERAMAKERQQLAQMGLS